MRFEHFPAAFALQRLVFVETAQVAQHRVRDVLGHLRRHAGVLQADQLGVARQDARLFAFEREDRIHARAQIEDRAQVVAAGQHLARRPPHDREVRRRGVARLPLAQIGLGQRAGKVVKPGGGIGMRHVEEDFHTVRKTPALSGRIAGKAPCDGCDARGASDDACGMEPPPFMGRLHSTFSTPIARVCGRPCNSPVTRHMAPAVARASRRPRRLLRRQSRRRHLDRHLAR